MSVSMEPSTGHQNPAYNPTEGSVNQDRVKDIDGLSTLFVSGTDIWAGGELAVPEVTTAKVSSLFWWINVKET